jgi:hypothetical protein
MNHIARSTRLFLAIACIAILSTGCATSKGSYQVTSAPPGDSKLSGYSDICVEVTCPNYVSMGAIDLERIKAQIVKSVPAECSGRFKCVDQPAADTRALRAKVNIVKYDRGNAFARAMLAGLGQMHINAEVTLTDYASTDELFRTEVSKTFAWGGLYGGTTQITDIEEGFAKAVAASFTGKAQKQQ